jgi:hypothetical protein
LGVVIRTKRSVIRFRSSLGDLCVLLAVLAAGVYLAYRYDFFHYRHTAVPKMVELDEAFLLIGLLAVGVALFYLRRIVDRRRATSRELATEEYVRTPEFQRALEKIVKPKKSGDSQTPPRPVAKIR